VAADIADRVPMTLQRLGHGIIGEGIRLIPVEEQEDTSPRVRPGG